MEDAVRLYRSGLKTVLLCHSERLAGHVRGRLAGVEPGVEADSLTDFCKRTAAKAAIRCDASSADTAIESMLNAIRSDAALKYDAVIVDDAQDFRTHWWIALEEMLADPPRSQLHAFFDTNQSIYGDFARELAAFQIIPIHLTRNLRNTRRIHAASAKFYRGIPVTADGPEGTEIEWHACEERDLARLVVARASKLINADQVAEEDIVILALSDNSVTTIRNRTGFPAGVDVVHVRNFKGLECKVAIVAATREIADEPELAYVALSRPSVHLIVCGAPHVVAWLHAPRAAASV